jgi:hypothetical protein
MIGSPMDGSASRPSVVSAAPRGQQGRTPVGWLLDGAVYGEQRTGQQQCQHPGKWLIALLVNEPQVAGGHRCGQRRGEQGQRFDARPRPCVHASIISQLRVRQSSGRVACHTMDANPARPPTRRALLFTLSAQRRDLLSVPLVARCPHSYYRPSAPGVDTGRGDVALRERVLLCTGSAERG